MRHLLLCALNLNNGLKNWKNDIFGTHIER